MVPVKGKEFVMMKEIKRFSIMGGVVHATLFFVVMILAFFDIHFILTQLISSVLMVQSFDNNIIAFTNNT